MSEIKPNTQGGYIALITSILLSVSLLVMIVAVSFEGFASRFTVLESELKEESDFLAEACVHTAILKYYVDNTYTGNDEMVHIGDKECQIHSVSGSASSLDIRTSASSSAAFTNLLVTIDASAFPDYDIDIWEEVPSHP